jgi:hypothetical protein
MKEEVVVPTQESLEAQPVTVKLTNALRGALREVAVAAVNAKDMESLMVLNEMKVDLNHALLQAVSSGFHDITRGLRRLGVPVTEYHVSCAVARSPESYWQLCGDRGVPVHPKAALVAALEGSKWPLVHALLAREDVAVTEGTLRSLAYAKKPLPREILEAVYAKLPDSSFTDAVMSLTAQHGTPSIIDRALRVAKGANVMRLTAVALRWGNMSVAQELLCRGFTLSPAIVEHFTLASYRTIGGVLRIKDHRDRDHIDATFLKTLREHSDGARLQITDVQPLIHEFLERIAVRTPCAPEVLGDWGHLHEREVLSALRDILTPASRPKLAQHIVRCADLIRDRGPDHRLQFDAKVRALVEADERACELAAEDVGPRP